MPEEPSKPPRPVLVRKEKPKPVPQTKFKTGDKVRSTTGSGEMTLGNVPDDATMETQVECYWTQPAVAKTEKAPAIEEGPRSTMFFLGQLALVP